MRRVKDEYNGFVLLSDKMIEIFRDKKHVPTCFLRSEFVKSYYPDLTEKKPCVLGEKVNCSTCGCIIPVIMHGISQIDFETAKVARSLFVY